MAVPDSALTDLPPNPYDSVRPALRTGDLVLCSGRSRFARAIRWATKSPWSHVAMIVRLDEIDRVMMLESVEKYGVRAVAFSRFVFGEGRALRPYAGKIVVARHSAFADQCDPAAIKKFAEFAAFRLGAPFSAVEVWKIALRIALDGLGIKLPRVLLPSDEFICSEYVARCYAVLGIDIVWDGKGFIAPADVAADARVTAIARIAAPLPPLTPARAPP